MDDTCREFLYVSNSFPPLVGGGAARTERNCRLLPDFNWRPTLLTITVDETEQTDRKYAEMGIEVLRAGTIVKENRFRGLPVGKGSKKASPSTRFLQVLSRWLFFPDRQVLWKFPAQRQAIKASRRHDWRCVFASVHSITTGWIGKCVAQRLQLPFILEYRDVIDEHYKRSVPTALHRAALCALERSLVRAAAKVVVVSPSMKQWFVERHDFNCENVEIITNGFIPEEKNFFRSFPKPENERFTMTYAGLLHGERRPDTILKAIHNLVHQGTIPADKLRAVFIGNLAPTAISAYGLEGIAESILKLPREEVLQWYAKSDLLLLICADNVYQNVTYPGKVFEYLITGKPILGLLNKNSGTAKILEESGVAMLADANSVKESAEKIKYFYDRWASRMLETKPNTEFIEQFNSRKLAKKLASIFDEACNIE